MGNSDFFVYLHYYPVIVIWVEINKFVSANKNSYSAMKRFLFFFLLASQCFAQAPTVKVNPDGTHTVVHHHGSTSIEVNPNGTHTVVHNHENTSIKVNPNGTHTVVNRNGNSSTQINPDGTHTLIFHHRNSSVQVNPDGTHTILQHSDNDNSDTSRRIRKQKRRNPIRSLFR